MVVTDVAGALLIMATKSLNLAEYMEFPLTWKVSSTLILNQPEKIQRRVTKHLINKFVAAARQYDQHIDA